MMFRTLLFPFVDKDLTDVRIEDNVMKHDCAVCAVTLPLAINCRYRCTTIQNMNRVSNRIQTLEALTKSRKISEITHSCIDIVFKLLSQSVMQLKYT